MPDFPPKTGATAAEVWAHASRVLTGGDNIDLPDQVFPFTNPASAVDLGNVQMDGTKKGTNPASAVDLTNLQAALSPTGTGREAKIDKILDFDEEGNGTLTPTDGTENTVREVTTKGKVHAYIDLTNMAAGDTVTIKEYIKIKSAGSYIVYASEEFSGAQSKPMLHVVMKPSKHGAKITLTQSAGTYRSFDWETLIEKTVA